MGYRRYASVCVCVAVILLQSLTVIRHLKLPASQLFVYPFVQTDIKYIMKKLHISGFCEEKPPVIGSLPSQRVGNVESAPMSWCVMTAIHPTQLVFEN